MRAAVITGHGGLETIQIADDLPMPEPGAREVRVKITAAALNRLDLWVREGWPGLKLNFPHIMCADGAGVIDALGSGVTGWHIGERVAINPLIVPADNPAWITGLENQTRDGHILGESIPGVAAEYVVVPARNLIRIPEKISDATAAAAGLVFLTAWHSLITRGQLKAGETVLIVGAGGGVNSASIQIAALTGATVYVVGSSSEKCAKAVEMGADIAFNRAENPDWSRWIHQKTNRRGVDVVVDNVGAATLNDSIRAARIGGRILTVGNTSGPKVEIDLRQIFFRHLSIIGSTMGPAQDYQTVMNLIFAEKLSVPIDSIIPMERARDAQEKLQRFDMFGKIVLQFGAGR